MARAIDHSAVLLPGDKRNRANGPGLSWTRLFFVFVYVTVTACAIVLLGLSWRSELNRRHAAEAKASTLGTALQTIEQRADHLDDRNGQLTTRATALERSISVVRRQASRRGDAIRQTRDVLRTMGTFVAALEGLDETVTDTVAAEKALAQPEARLGKDLKALDDYLRVTPKGSLDRPLLRARLRALERDLGALQNIIARLTEGNAALDEAVDPLGQTTDLNRALRAALTRSKLALRR